MNYIDLETWSRRDHFPFFQRSRNPCLGITAQVSIKNFLAYRKARNGTLRFTDCLYYASMKSVNAIPELRMRIVGMRPVAFETIHAGFTYVSKASKLHSNCRAEYDEDFTVFKENIQAARERADAHPSLYPEHGESQDLVYMTCLKDVAFTSLSNPWGDPWVDTVPRVAFGKVDQEAKTMPVSIEALHSFIDGMHVGAFLRMFEEIVNNPAAHFAD